MYHRLRAILLLLTLVTIPALSIQAGDASFGARAGFGGNPDQFVAGLQASFGHPLKFFRFAPSFDLGFGSDVTTYCLNGDLRLAFVPRGSGTLFYAGAGPTLINSSFSNDQNNTDVGLTLSGGVMLPLGNSNRYNVEVRAGIGDVPDYRILLGIMFGGREPVPAEDPVGTE